MWDLCVPSLFVLWIVSLFYSTAIASDRSTIFLVYLNALRKMNDLTLPLPISSSSLTASWVDESSSEAVFAGSNEPLLF